MSINFTKYHIFTKDYVTSIYNIPIMTIHVKFAISNSYLQICLLLVVLR